MDLRYKTSVDLHSQGKYKFAEGKRNLILLSGGIVEAMERPTGEVEAYLGVIRWNPCITLGRYFARPD